MRTGPFEQHLREAIALNRARAPLYAALTDRTSLGVSRKLLCAQHLSLPMARWLDHKAAPYHRAGIPLLEQVFVSMHDAPSFAFPAPVTSLADYGPPMAGSIRRRVRDAYCRSGFAGASRMLELEIAALSRRPCFDCMLRHLLESALRASNLAPLHAAQARRADSRLPNGCRGFCCACTGGDFRGPHGSIWRPGRCRRRECLSYAGTFRRSLLGQKE